MYSLRVLTMPLYSRTILMAEADFVSIKLIELPEQTSTRLHLLNS